MRDGKAKELKTFAEAMLDVDRLKIVGELAKGSGDVKGLAARVDMAPKKVLAHLRKLSRTGVVSLQSLDEDVTYVLNPDALEKMARRQFTHAKALAEVEPDLRIIDEKFTAELVDIIKKHTNRNGTLKELPSAYKTDVLDVVLRYLLQYVEAGKKYTELELNRVYKPVYRDFASIRRYLVEMGYMDRLPDGSAYWLTALGEAEVQQ